MRLKDISIRFDYYLFFAMVLLIAEISGVSIAGHLFSGMSGSDDAAGEGSAVLAVPLPASGCCGRISVARRRPRCWREDPGLAVKEHYVRH